MFKPSIKQKCLVKAIKVQAQVINWYRFRECVFHAKRLRGKWTLKTLTYFYRNYLHDLNSWTWVRQMFNFFFLTSFKDGFVQFSAEISWVTWRVIKRSQVLRRKWRRSFIKFIEICMRFSFSFSSFDSHSLDSLTLRWHNFIKFSSHEARHTF